MVAVGIHVPVPVSNDIETRDKETAIDSDINIEGRNITPSSGEMGATVGRRRSNFGNNQLLQAEGPPRIHDEGNVVETTLQLPPALRISIASTEPQREQSRSEEAAQSGTLNCEVCSRAFHDRYKLKLWEDHTAKCKRPPLSESMFDLTIGSYVRTQCTG